MSAATPFRGCRASPSRRCIIAVTGLRTPARGSCAVFLDLRLGSVRSLCAVADERSTLWLLLAYIAVALRRVPAPRRALDRDPGDDRLGRRRRGILLRLHAEAPSATDDLLEIPLMAVLAYLLRRVRHQRPGSSEIVLRDEDAPGEADRRATARDRRLRRGRTRRDLEPRGRGALRLARRRGDRAGRTRSSRPASEAQSDELLRAHPARRAAERRRGRRGRRATAPCSS